MKQLVTSIFLLLLLTGSCFAQGDPILWSQTLGPNGGNVTSVCVDSGNTMYVSTQVSGMFRSTNKGDTWHPVNRGLKRLQGKQIVSDGGQFVYVMTYYSEMLRLGDFELGWKELPVMINGSIAVSFSQMAAGKNGAIFISTSGHGIMRTTDHGDSWHELGDSAFRSQTFLYVTVAANGDVYGVQFKNSSKFNYVYKSVDNGETWVKLPKEIPTVEDPFCIAIAHDNSILLGTYWGHVFRSPDGGNSWSEVLTHPNNHNIEFILRGDHNANNALYLTTHSNMQGQQQTKTGGFFRSTDNGATWVLRDGTEHGESKFWIAETKDGDVYHSSVPLGLIKSSDQGTQWFDKNNGILAQFVDGVAVNSKGQVFSVTQFAMNRLIPPSENWIPLNFISREAFRPPLLYVANNDILLHGSYYGLFRSVNDGNSWDQVLFEDTNVKSNLIYDVEQGSNGDIFAASFNTGLMVSKDQGKTWERVPNLSPTTRMTAIGCGANGVMLCADEASYFWLSENHGINWTDVSPDNNGCSQIDAHPSGAFIARFGFHVDISHDKGRTWQWIFPDSAHAAQRPDWITYSTFVDRHGAILVTTDSGIYRSKAEPYNEWEFVARGLTAPDYALTNFTNVSELAQNNSTGVFYAASRGQSVYRSLPDLGVRSSSANIMSAKQNYPNPFSGRTIIPLEVKEQGKVVVTISNVVGSFRRIVANEFFAQGRHELSLAADDFPTGSYLYTIEYPDGTRESNMMMLTK
jgi:photosystem II stability/assembly factor-like uncharacterized protein